MCIDVVEILFGIADAHHTSVFSFLDDNFSKSQWIFTKLGKCFGIVKIWFGIANGYILAIFDIVFCLPHILVGYYCFMLLFFYFHLSSVFVWSS